MQEQQDLLTDQVKCTKIDGQFVVNPTPKEAEKAELNVIIAGTVDNILMVEGEAKECSEADLVEAIKVGHEIIIKQNSSKKNI